MKIAVTSMGKELADQVSGRFGRAPYLLVVNTEDTSLVKAIENPNVMAAGGAGVQTAQLIVDSEVEAVLTGNCGPKAFQVFNAAGVKVFTGANGLVQESIAKFRAGEFSEAADANVAPHAGMNT